MKCKYFEAILIFTIAITSHPVKATPTDSSRLPMIAVMPLVGKGVDDAASQVATDALSDELLKTNKFRVLERSQINSILKEQGFSESGACDGSECAVKMGRLLSIEDIIVGTIGKIGSSYSLSIRIVNVETGEIIGSVRKMQRGEIDQIVSELLPEATYELVHSLPGKMIESKIIDNNSREEIMSKRDSEALPMRNDELKSSTERVSLANDGLKKYSFGIDISGIVNVPKSMYKGGSWEEVVGYSGKIAAALQLRWSEKISLRTSVGYSAANFSLKESDSTLKLYSSYSKMIPQERKEDYQANFVSIASNLTYTFFSKILINSGLTLNIPVDVRLKETVTDADSSISNTTNTLSTYPILYFDIGVGYAISSTWKIGVTAHSAMGAFIDNTVTLHQVSLDLSHDFL